MSDFFKLNLLDGAETLRIGAAGEVINATEYEHDPRTLGDFPVSKTPKFNIFAILEVFIPFRAPLLAPGRFPPIAKRLIFSS